MSKEWDALIARVTALEGIQSADVGGLDPSTLPFDAIQTQLEQNWKPDADTFLLPHSVGADAMGTMPYWLLSLSANSPAIANAGSLLISWTNSQADPFSMHPSGGQVVTMPQSGVYVAGMGGFTGAGAMDATILVNGTNDQRAYNNATVAGVGWVGVMGLFVLKQGDTLGVLVDNNSGAPQVLAGNTTNAQAAKFWGHFLFPTTP